MGVGESPCEPKQEETVGAPEPRERRRRPPTYTRHPSWRLASNLRGAPSPGLAPRRRIFRCVFCGRVTTWVYLAPGGGELRCRRCSGSSYESAKWSYPGEWWTWLPNYRPREWGVRNGELPRGPMLPPPPLCGIPDTTVRPCFLSHGRTSLFSSQPGPPWRLAGGVPPSTWPQLQRPESSAIHERRDSCSRAPAVLARPTSRA